MLLWKADKLMVAETSPNLEQTEQTSNTSTNCEQLLCVKLEIFRLQKRNNIQVQEQLYYIHLIQHHVFDSNWLEQSIWVSVWSPIFTSQLFQRHMRVGNDGSPLSSSPKWAENPNISEFQVDKIQSLLFQFVSCCEVVGGRGYIVMALRQCSL